MALIQCEYCDNLAEGGTGYHIERESHTDDIETVWFVCNACGGKHYSYATDSAIRKLQKRVDRCKERLYAYAKLAKDAPTSFNKYRYNALVEDYEKLKAEAISAMDSLKECLAVKS